MIRIFLSCLKKRDRFDSFELFKNVLYLLASFCSFVVSDSRLLIFLLGTSPFFFLFSMRATILADMITDVTVNPFKNTSRKKKNFTDTILHLFLAQKMSAKKKHYDSYRFAFFSCSSLFRFSSFSLLFSSLLSLVLFYPPLSSSVSFHLSLLTCLSLSLVLISLTHTISLSCQFALSLLNDNDNDHSFSRLSLYVQLTLALNTRVHGPRPIRGFGEVSASRKKNIYQWLVAQAPTKKLASVFVVVVV